MALSPLYSLLIAIVGLSITYSTAELSGTFATEHFSKRNEAERDVITKLLLGNEKTFQECLTIGKEIGQLILSENWEYNLGAWSIDFYNPDLGGIPFTLYDVAKAGYFQPGPNLHCAILKHYILVRTELYKHILQEQQAHKLVESQSEGSAPQGEGSASQGEGSAESSGESSEEESSELTIQKSSQAIRATQTDPPTPTDITSLQQKLEQLQSKIASCNCAIFTEETSYVVQAIALVSGGISLLSFGLMILTLYSKKGAERETNQPRNNCPNQIPLLETQQQDQPQAIPSAPTCSSTPEPENPFYRPNSQVRNNRRFTTVKY